MKYEQHEERKSLDKWAMPGQRVLTQDMQALERRRLKAMMAGKPFDNIGKNNGPLKHSVPGQIASQHLPAFLGMIKGHDRFLPRDVGRSNGGARVPSKGKIIPAHQYS
jgi:hypothetical protein